MTYCCHGWGWRWWFKLILVQFASKEIHRKLLILVFVELTGEFAIEPTLGWEVTRRWAASRSNFSSGCSWQSCSYLVLLSLHWLLMTSGKLWNPESGQLWTRLRIWMIKSPNSHISLMYSHIFLQPGSINFFFFFFFYVFKMTLVLFHFFEYIYQKLISWITVCC